MNGSTQRSDPIRLEVLILDAAEPWLGRGVRTLVVSRALLDLLEDRALAGLLAQARAQVRAASLPGELVVWLGNLPAAGAWYLTQSLMQLGRVLADRGRRKPRPAAGAWPAVSRAGPAACSAPPSSACSDQRSSRSGLSAAGLGLLLAWAVVPALQTLLNWETRRAETAADIATLDAGLGWELLEALETLAWAASVPPPAAPLGWLSRPATPSPPAPTASGKRSRSPERQPPNHRQRPNERRKNNPVDHPFDFRPR